MTAIAGMRWICGASIVAAIVVASLIPANWQIRTGLHWQVEHFLAYFIATAIFCLAWPKPFVVALVLIPFAALLEALQGLTPDRVPDLPRALSAAAGVLTAALLAKLVIEVAKSVWRPAIRPADSQSRPLAQPDEI